MHSQSKKDEMLNNKVRRDILDSVTQAHGMSLTDIATASGLDRSSIIWHTTKLTRGGHLRTDLILGRRMFYATKGGVPERNAAIAAITLRQPCTRWLYSVMQQNPGLSLTRLANLASMSVSRAHGHAARLLESNLAVRRPARRGMAFFPLPCGDQFFETMPCRIADGTRM